MGAAGPRARGGASAAGGGQAGGGQAGGGQAGGAGAGRQGGGGQGGCHQGEHKVAPGARVATHSPPRPAAGAAHFVAPTLFRPQTVVGTSLSARRDEGTKTKR